MSRYALAQAQPPQETTEGDAHFIGMNSRVDRDKLESGFFPLGINNRCRRGDAMPRGGVMTPGFANAEEFGTIMGSGLFSNPNGDEVILVATGEGVWQLRAGTAPELIPVMGEAVDDERLPIALTGPTVEFSQHFGTILLHDIDTTYAWDGISPDGFVPIEKSDPADTSTVIVPPAPWAFDLLGRNFFPISHDQIGISDLLDYTSYDAALRTYRVNSGTSDGIIGAYPYAQNSVVIGKQRSFDLLTGLNTLGSSNEAVAMEVLTTTRGLLARRSWQMVGGDGYFLADDRHIYKLGSVVTERLEASPVPISALIEPVMQRINGTYAPNAVAEVYGEYYFLAVPLDESTVNNAVLVYNTTTQNFEGYDTWEGDEMQIDNFIVANYLGAGRLFAVNHAGLGSVHLMYEGEEDQLGSAAYEIRHTLETRGYATLGWNSATRRDFQRVEFSFSTWDPDITITALTDSALDERVLTPTPITRDRTKYQVFGMPDFVPTNENDDFEVPGREDYSVDVDTGIDLYPEGLAFDTQQSMVARFALKARGRFVSFRVENIQGQCHIGGVLMQSSGSQREPRRAS